MHARKVPFRKEEKLLAHGCEASLEWKASFLAFKAMFAQNYVKTEKDQFKQCTTKHQKSKK